MWWRSKSGFSTLQTPQRQLFRYVRDPEHNVSWRTEQGVKNDSGSTKVWTIRELLPSCTDSWLIYSSLAQQQLQWFLSISTCADSWKSIFLLLVGFIAVENVGPLWHPCWGLLCALLHVKPKISRGRFLQAVATPRAHLKLKLFVALCCRIQANIANKLI